MGKKTTQKKIRKTSSTIILICLIAIALISGYKVFTMVKDYLKDQNSYKNVTKSANADNFTGDINFDELKKINPEVVAWIYLKDTKINYPIVQGPNNDKYLSTLFDGSVGGAGTLFSDCNTVDPFHQFSTIVYGHHMKDKSMFHDLKYYADYSYAEEHKQFELILPDGKYHLMVYAFLNAQSDSYLYTINVDGAEKQNYINWITSKASYTMPGVEVSVDDRIVCLSTCAFSDINARYIVVGKMVPWEEKSKKTDKKKDK